MEMTKETILGVDVTKTSEDDLSQHLLNNIINEDKQAFIVAINPEKITLANKDRELKTLLNQATIQIPDGVGVLIASKLQGGNITERITGVDLMERLIKDAATHKKRVFFYGAKPGTADAAKTNLTNKYPGLNVVGIIDGYEQNTRYIIETINQQKPDYLFVALGSPKQEQWIVEHMGELNVRVFQGVGGSFDVFSGKAKRAPEAYRKLGLEWLYRLLKEPHRIKRQIRLPLFFLQVLKARVLKK